MTSDKVLSDAQLKAEIDNSGKLGWNGFFNIQAAFEENPADYYIAVPLSINASNEEEMNVYLGRLNSDGSFEGEISSISTYKLKDASNVVFTRDIKNIGDETKISEVGMKALNLAVDVERLANEITGMTPEYTHDNPSPNKLQNQYQNSGIEYSDLQKIKNNLNTYRAKLFSGGPVNNEQLDKINEIEKQIDKTLTELDYNIAEPKIASDFEEKVRNSEVLTYDQQNSLLKRLDEGYKNEGQSFKIASPN